MKQSVTTKNQTETITFAEKLSQNLKSGDILLLEGDLGAGKTTFTKGLAKGLGITQIIKSPTFVIVREYTSGKLPLYHMDVYRLNGANDSDLGLEEYFDGEGICVVEWAQFIADILPEEYLKITIKRTGDIARDLYIETKGKRYDELKAEVFKR